VDKETYLAKKQEVASIDYGRQLCLRCLRDTKSCLCQNIIPFATKCELKILMHPKEAKKEKVGTARLASLCLKNSSIIVDVNFSKNKEVIRLLADENYFPMLLYPGDDSHNISSAPLPSAMLKEKKLLIFVIDGTWACAKTMMRESEILHHLPRISFDVKQASRFVIKQQPARFCLSTIESIYELLHNLNKWQHENLGNKHTVLLEILDKLVSFQIDCAKDPLRQSYRKGNYQVPQARPYSKKWEKWKICYEDKNYSNQRFPHGVGRRE